MGYGKVKAPGLAWSLSAATVVMTLVTGAALWLLREPILAMAAQTRFDGVDLGPLARAPLAVQIHAGAALSALVVGTVILLGPKGTAWHRTSGWAWVVLMAITAFSACFILDINDGLPSFIHGFVALTVISLPMGIAAARRGDIKEHRGRMMGLFIGGLIVAGAFTLLPGRLMWQVMFG